MRTRPDILVLGGGGLLGEAWMTGVLAGLEDGTGFRLAECDRFLGTSAGSIVAAKLAAGQPLRRPRTEPHLLPALPEVRYRRTMPALATTVAEPVRSMANILLAPLSNATANVASPMAALALGLSAPFASAALGVSSPAGALARIAALRVLPTATGSLEQLREYFETLALSFDGRLGVSAVNRSTGRRVIFGSPGAPAASVAEAVQASCTVPWLFPPVPIAGARYVDGGVWSPTNLDAAPVRSLGTRPVRVLCLNPTGGLRGSHPVLGAARRASAGVMALEAAALRSRGAQVRSVVPSPDTAEHMGANLMSAAPRHEVLAAGYRQGLELAATG